MTEYRYPLGRIVADCSLFGSGAVMCAVIVALVPTVLYAVVIFGGLTGVFLLFTIRAALQARLRIAADAEGMKITGIGVRSVKWVELDAVRLRYYSTKRSRKDGWMTLTLSGGGQRLRVESHLDGFEAVARLVAAAARERGIALDHATHANFAALGLLPGEGVA